MPRSSSNFHSAFQFVLNLLRQGITECLCTSLRPRLHDEVPLTRCGVDWLRNCSIWTNLNRPPDGSVLAVVSWTFEYDKLTSSLTLRQCSTTHHLTSESVTRTLTGFVP